MIFLQSAGSNSRSGKRPCSLRGRFPVLENAPAVCTDIFPFWKMPLQSARTHSRSGKCPCSLQGHFPILESLPADCRKLFLTNFHILTCISTSSPLFCNYSKGTPDRCSREHSTAVRGNTRPLFEGTPDCCSGEHPTAVRRNTAPPSREAKTLG